MSCGRRASSCGLRLNTCGSPHGCGRRSSTCQSTSRAIFLPGRASFPGNWLDQSSDHKLSYNLWIHRLCHRLSRSVRQALVRPARSTVRLSAGGRSPALSIVDLLDHASVPCEPYSRSAVEATAHARLCVSRSLRPQVPNGIRRRTASAGTARRPPSRSAARPSRRGPPLCSPTRRS